MQKKDLDLNLFKFFELLYQIDERNKKNKEKEITPTKKNSCELVENEMD